MSKKNNSNNKSAAAAAAAAASGRGANDAPPPVAQSNPSTHDVLSTLFNLVGANNHARNNHLTATLPAYAYHSGWLGAPTAARRTFGAFLVFYRALHDHVRNVGPAHTQTLEALANELWNVTINAVPAGGGRELFSARCAALTPEARLTIAVLPVAGAAVSTARSARRR